MHVRAPRIRNGMFTFTRDKKRGSLPPIYFDEDLKAYAAILQDRFGKIAVFKEPVDLSVLTNSLSKNYPESIGAKYVKFPEIVKQ